MRLSKLACRLVLFHPQNKGSRSAPCKRKPGTRMTGESSLALLHLLNKGGELFGLLGEVGNGCGSLFHSFSREL